MKRLHTLAACLFAAALLVPASPATAASPGGHCPPAVSGYQIWDVNTEPYRADNGVDEKGNNNGLVCAKAEKIVLDDNGEPFQIYNFIDDTGNLP
jgi:hypothetical protein